MEISGKVIAKLPLQSGTAKSTGRPWKKQEYVLETHDQYHRQVKFDFFGERVDQYPLEIGDEVTVSFDLESREFSGRWYTDVRAWKAEKGQPNGGFGAPTQANPPFDAPAPGAAPFNPAAPAAPQFGAAPAFDAAPASPTEDLPF